MSIEQLDYSHFGRCCAIRNDETELYVTLDLGPRIICYRRRGGTNILAEIKPEGGERNPFGTWHLYGGHRLWHAPEHSPRSYIPDNEPVDLEEVCERSVRVTQTLEPVTHIRKQMLISLDPSGSRVTIDHTLTNEGLWAVELAPWALTIVNGGGVTIFPQEPFIPHGESLLPARPMVLWSYTDLSDPRWTFWKRFMLLHSDEKMNSPQKVGVANKQGWAAYLREGTLFVKRFPYIEGATYPDYGCNFETFTNGLFVEVETLGPVATLQPGRSVTHSEQWFLFDGVREPRDDDEMESTLAPLLAKTLP